MALPTLAQLDRFASPYDSEDSVGALPSYAVTIAGDSDLDSLEGVDPDDLLAGVSDVDDELAWGWRSIRRGFRKAYRSARKVTRSSTFRIAAAGVAIAFPAAAPAVVALEAANRVAAQVEQGNEAAHKAIEATRRAAKAGDPGARRALRHIHVALKARAAARQAVKSAPQPVKPKGTHQPPGPVRGVLMAADGSRLPGVWVRA